MRARDRQRILNRLRKETAHHEAGHALVAWGMGLGVECIEIMPAEDWLREDARLPVSGLVGALGNCRVSFGFGDLDRWGWCLRLLHRLGGPAADAVCRIDPEATDDLEELLDRECGAPGADVQEAWREALGIVLPGVSVDWRGTMWLDGVELSPRKRGILVGNAWRILGACWTPVLRFAGDHRRELDAIARRLLAVQSFEGFELNRLAPNVEFHGYAPRLPALGRARKALARD